MLSGALTNVSVGLDLLRLASNADVLECRLDNFVIGVLIRSTLSTFLRLINVGVRKDIRKC